MPSGVNPYNVYHTGYTDSTGTTIQTTGPSHAPPSGSSPYLPSASSTMTTNPTPVPTGNPGFGVHPGPPCAMGFLGDEVLDLGSSGYVKLIDVLFAGAGVMFLVAGHPILGLVLLALALLSFTVVYPLVPGGVWC